MRPAIDQVIGVGGDESKQISGAEIAQIGSRAQNTEVTLQIVPQAAGDFEVHIEGAINTMNGASFDSFGSYDQDSDTLFSIVPISLGCLYRFKHISGVSCRVLLTG